MNRLVSVGLTFALCMPAAFAQPAPGTPDVKALVDDLRGSNLAHRDEATSKLLASGTRPERPSRPSWRAFRIPTPASGGQP
jgi:hypothetical protein